MKSIPTIGQDTLELTDFYIFPRTQSSKFFWPSSINASITLELAGNGDNKRHNNHFTKIFMISRNITFVKTECESGVFNFLKILPQNMLFCVIKCVALCN